MEKVAFLQELANRRDIRHLDSLVPAFVSCLTSEEACDALASLAIRSELLRRSILRKVIRDAETLGFLSCHTQLVSDLLSRFPSLEYRDKQTVASILHALHPYSPDSLKQQLITFFLMSKYVALRRSGYALLREQWRPGNADQISLTWEKHRDVECAALIVDHFDDEFILRRLDELSRVLDGQPAMARLFIRAGRVKPDELSRLAEKDPVTFAYVMVKLGRTVTTEEALALFERVKFDQRVGLLIWSFGRMGLWPVLEIISNKFEESKHLMDEYLRSVRSKYSPQLDRSANEPHSSR